MYHGRKTPVDKQHAKRQPFARTVPSASVSTKKFLEEHKFWQLYWAKNNFLREPLFGPAHMAENFLAYLLARTPTHSSTRQLAR
jgi:hypothetical protein